MKLLGGTLALALGMSNVSTGAVDTATVLNTSVMLTDSLQAMYTYSAPGDVQYWNNGVWRYRNPAINSYDFLDWGIHAGPSTTAATLFLWRQKHNYTFLGADNSINSWLRVTATSGISSVITHINADGSYGDFSLPQTQMALADVATSYLALRDTLDPVTRAKWLNAMMRMVNFLIVNGDLPNPAKSGWQGTEGWYTNGNYELVEAEVLYQMYLATGDDRYKTLFDTQWTAALYPNPNDIWKEFGLKIDDPQPTQADYSDGVGYLAEKGSGKPGYDGDYTQAQSLFLGRLYSLLPDAPRKKILNLLINKQIGVPQHPGYVNFNTWVLDASNGSRHNTTAPYTTEGLDELAWLGGRADFTAYAGPQFSKAIYPTYINNAFGNSGVPGVYRGYATGPAVLLQTDLISTSIPSVPQAPTAVISHGQITLTWPASIGALSYNVKRSTVSGGSYSTIAYNNPPNTFTDKTASNSLPYYYVVSAVNLAGESGNSAQVQATANPVAPAAPSNLVSTAGNSQVQLVWLQSTGAVNYNVKRSTVSGGSYSTIATVAANTLNISPYISAGLNNGTAYYYVVTATNSYGESANSPETISTPFLYTAPPQLVVTPDPAKMNAQAELRWYGVKGAVSYNVKRSTTSGGSYSTIANVPYPPPVTTPPTPPNLYVDKNLTNGAVYYYVVSAVYDASGTEGSNSPQAVAQPTTLPPPTDVFVKPSSSQIVVSWPSTGVPSYHVKRSSGGAYTLIASPTTNSFVDTTAASGTLYYYIVSSASGSVEGPNSPYSTGMRASASTPGIPTGLSATGSSVPQVVINWGAVSGATSYNLKRSTVVFKPVLSA